MEQDYLKFMLLLIKESYSMRNGNYWGLGANKSNRQYYINSIDSFIGYNWNEFFSKYGYELDLNAHLHPKKVKPNKVTSLLRG